MASIKPLIGVNLGGWLVLEPWMTPSLFKGTSTVDEHTYCQTADRKRLKRFRDTFIQESDIVWLSEQGVQAVRVPVGYWLFGNEEPYLPTYRYLDKLFDWSEKHGLKVLISLHGAPGSQNGEMHSGRRGAIGWTDQKNIEKTIISLVSIAERYGTRSSLLGISLLNEPSRSIPIAVLEDFYVRAADRLKPHLKPDKWLIFSDGFRPGRWRRRMKQQVLDHHRYQIFSVLDRLSPTWLHLIRARFALPPRVRSMAAKHRLVIGEWSIALPGKRTSATYERYAAAQLSSLQKADAWFYWSYKTEFGGPWSFRDSVEKALLKLP